MSASATNSTSAPLSNAGMKMSPEARARMRASEKVVMRYYNDMGKNRGNCTWGAGFLAHKGVCSAEELQLKVSAPSIDIEYAKRVAEAERRVRRKVTVPLNQAQFDALVSFTYNTSNIANQRVYDRVNSGDFAKTAEAISDAVKVDVGGGKKKKFVLAPGLIRRRVEESAPFRAAAERAKPMIGATE
jgi:GH24 family phage-related lysozyme (muramidase)